MQNSEKQTLKKKFKHIKQNKLTQPKNSKHYLNTKR